MALSSTSEEKGPLILSVVSVMTALAFLVVALRLYVRTAIVRNFGIDDALIVVAMGISIIGLGIVITEVHYGAGQHVTVLTPGENITGLKYNFISQTLYLWSPAFVKFSIGFFLLRLAPNKSFRVGLQLFVAWLFLYTIACEFTILFQCRPIRKSFDFTSPGTCFSAGTLQGLSYFNSVVSIVSDFTFALLPIPMLWNVQINRRTKVALMGILSLGFFASSSSIVKAVFLRNYGKTGDFLFDSAELTIWSAVETNIGIIAASIPSLKPIFKSLLATSQRYYGTAGGGGKTSQKYGSRDASGYIKQASVLDSDRGGDRNGRDTYSMHAYPNKGSTRASIHATSGHGSSKIPTSSTFTSSRTMPRGDDSSEEFILGHGGAGGSIGGMEQGITKTTEIVISEDIAEYQVDTEIGDGGVVGSEGERRAAAPGDYYARYRNAG